MFHELTEDAPALRSKIFRFPTKSYELPANPLTCLFNERPNKVQQARISMVTFGAFAAYFGRYYAPVQQLSPPIVAIIDEAQSFWQSMQAFFLPHLHHQAFVLLIGYP